MTMWITAWRAHSAGRTYLSEFATRPEAEKRYRSLLERYETEHERGNDPMLLLAEVSHVKGMV